MNSYESINTDLNNEGLSGELISFLVVIIIYTVSIFFVIHNNDASAITSNNNVNSLLIQGRGFLNSVIPYHDARDITYHSEFSTIATALFHHISFADDTLFPQTFESSGTSSNDITLSNGKTLPARPITLTVNKIEANNTLVVTLHSFNDKYLLTGNLRGPAKPMANSNSDNAQFSLTGDITINKSTSYSVIAAMSEDKSKQVSLSITDAKTPNNFQVTLGFSPPHTEQSLAE